MDFFQRERRYFYNVFVTGYKPSPSYVTLSCHTDSYQITHSCNSSFLRNNIQRILKCQSIERKKPDAHSRGPFGDDKVDIAERLAGRVRAGQRIHGESG